MLLLIKMHPWSMDVPGSTTGYNQVYALSNKTFSIILENKLVYGCQNGHKHFGQLAIETSTQGCVLCSY